MYHVNLYGAHHCSLTLHITKSHSQRRNARKKKLCTVAVAAAFFPSSSFLCIYLVMKCTHAPIPTHQNTSSVRCLFLFINFCVKFLVYTRQRNWNKKKKWKRKYTGFSFRDECLCMLNREKKEPNDWEMLFIDDNDSNDEWELRRLSGSNVFGNTDTHNVIHGTPIRIRNISLILLNELEAPSLCIIKYLHTWFCLVHSHHALETDVEV